MKIDILYEDSHIIVLRKEAGVPVQSASVLSRDLVSLLKTYLYEKEPEKGEPYLGLIHRLDQPVEGIVVFAKTKKAARELSRQNQEKEMHKEYLAVLEGEAPKEQDTLENFLKKNGKTNTSCVVQEKIPGAKRAVLSYQIEKKVNEEERVFSLARIRLDTGRHHQIRVQMAHAGVPLYGDAKYNPGGRTAQKFPALCASHLKFVHPATKRTMEFTIEPTADIYEKMKTANS